MAPAVAELETQYEDDVRFIGISGQDDPEEMAAFVDDFGMAGFEHVADIHGQIWVSFGVTAQPSYVFINDDGAITRQVGGMSAEDLEATIEQLIAD